MVWLYPLNLASINVLEGVFVMNSVQLKVNVPAKSSRKELLVRLVYWIPLVFVAYVLELATLICLIVNFFSVLFRQRVSMTFAKVQKTTVDYLTKMWAYYTFLTDERPPIIPEG